MSLTASLISIAASTTAKQLLRGHAPTFDEWTDVAKDVVGVMVDESFKIVHHPQNPRSSATGSVSEPWIRQYNRHMIAGRRFLMDLPDEWRQSKHKDEMIGDARREFVRASATAEEAEDLFRSAQAEAAIAGCWLCVPSMKDVRKTLIHASQLVQDVTERDSAHAIAAWVEVQELCSAYEVDFAGGKLMASYVIYQVDTIFDPRPQPFEQWVRQQ